MTDPVDPIITDGEWWRGLEWRTVKTFDDKVVEIEVPLVDGYAMPIWEIEALDPECSAIFDDGEHEPNHDQALIAGYITRPTKTTIRFFAVCTDCWGSVELRDHHEFNWLMFKQYGPPIVPFFAEAVG